MASKEENGSADDREIITYENVTEMAHEVHIQCQQMVADVLHHEFAAASLVVEALTACSPELDKETSEMLLQSKDFTDFLSEIQAEIDNCEHIISSLDEYVTRVEEGAERQLALLAN